MSENVFVSITIELTLKLYELYEARCNSNQVIWTFNEREVHIASFDLQHWLFECDDREKCLLWLSRS